MQVGSGSVDVDHGDGRKYSETFTFQKMLPAGPHDVAINFVNFAKGLNGLETNLEIQDVRWDGKSYGPDPDLTLRSNGSSLIHVGQ